MDIANVISNCGEIVKEISGKVTGVIDTANYVVLPKIMLGANYAAASDSANVSSGGQHGSMELGDALLSAAIIQTMVGLAVRKKRRDFSIALYVTAGLYGLASLGAYYANK